MSNATPSRLGLVNATGTGVNDLFLKLYSGEVLASFQRENRMLGMTNVRTIANGKSASFPVTGRTTASYHSVGAEITGDAIKHNEKIINIDDMLLSSSFVAELDELKLHYDVRSIYASEMGQALAKTVDQNLLQLAVLGANASTTITGQDGGTVITDADANTNATSLIASIFECIQKLDEKDVPTTDRYIVVSPDIYYQLANNDKLLNRDFSTLNGDFGKGTVVSIGGVPVIKSNTAVSAFADNSTQATGTNNTYHIDASNYVAVCFHKSAIGTVKLKDLVVETTYDARRLGSLITGRMAIGSSILRPESCTAIKTS
tara:strand:- start:11003 stop:11953 length:951 start_codon:yes stop_codon:yes gene_type:complete